MTQSESIVCKPTQWFLIRAAAMLLMFSVFAVMFYKDGSVGYRKKNETYYLYKTFEKANQEFSKMNPDGSLTPEAWETYADAQKVDFPEDPSLLPSGLKQPMPWPEILHNHDRMKPLQWNLLWKEYSSKQGLDFDAPEEPYSAQKIREQWIVLWICLTLIAVTAFFLIRISRRSITADQQGIVDSKGRAIPYEDMKRLDLRKWDTKGVAFIDYDGASGKGKARIDGFIYGGFNKQQNEPAEQLMKLIRSRFSGEIIEYALVVEPEKAEDDSTPA